MNEWMNEYPLLKQDQNKSSNALGVVYTRKYNHSYLTTAYIKDKKAKNER